MPLTVALATTATMLLAASKIADVLNAGFEFDPVNLIFAFPVAAAAALLLTALTHDILNSRPLQARKSPRTATTSLLTAIGTLALAIIAVEHPDRLPGIDGWIGVAGGLLMLAAAAADHHPRPQAAATPATQDRHTSAPVRGTPESRGAPDP